MGLIVLMRNIMTCIEFPKRYLSAKYGIMTGSLNPNTFWKGGFDNLNKKLFNSGFNYSFVKHNNSEGFTLPHADNLSLRSALVSVNA